MRYDATSALMHTGRHYGYGVTVKLHLLLVCYEGGLLREAVLGHVMDAASNSGKE